MGSEFTEQEDMCQLAQQGRKLGPEGWVELRQVEEGHFNGQNLHQPSQMVEGEA